MLFWNNKRHVIATIHHLKESATDLGEVHVFYQDRFLCRAICTELGDRKVTLKEIEQARTARRKQVRAELNTREAMINRFVEMHHAPPPAPKRWWQSPRQSKHAQNSKGTSMTEQDGGNPQHFVATKNARRFGKMCDACRQARVVGLGYGPPGTGKTESAKHDAQWNLFQPYLPESLITFTGRSAMDGMYPYRPFTFAPAPLEGSLQECRTVFYTPPVSASVSRIEKEVLTLFAAFSYLVEAAHQRHQGTEDFLVTRRFSHLIELLIVDEANRLRDAGLEVIRDLADRGEFGLVHLGMPGLEKRLMRAPQLYSRVGFAHEMEPLSEEEMHDFLGRRWGHRVKPHSDDFTDKEAVATIVRITRGNLRLIDRLMLQVEHVLLANILQVVTKEVVETARQNLIIGPGKPEPNDEVSQYRSFSEITVSRRRPKCVYRKDKGSIMRYRIAKERVCLSKSSFVTHVKMKHS